MTCGRSCDSSQRRFGSTKDMMLSTSVRIQAEAMLWLIVVEATLRRTFAVLVPDVLLMGEGQDIWKIVWKEGTVLLECGSTTALVLWILQWRFSPGENTRAGCRRSNQSDCQFVNKVVYFLVSLAVLGMTAGSVLGGASWSNFSSLASFRSRAVGTSKAAVTSMIRDPILEETLYRGVIFDRLLRRDCQTMAREAVLQAASASSLFFGGVHLFMHLLREGARLSWVVYYQAFFAACAGYVYCLLFFLTGGRLLPAVLLHSVNNIAASFYCSPNHGSKGHGIQSGVANATAISSSRMMAIHLPACGLTGRQGVGQTLRGSIDEHFTAVMPWLTYAGLFATVVAYWAVGRACSARISGSSRRRH